MPARFSRLTALLFLTTPFTSLANPPGPLPLAEVQKKFACELNFQTRNGWEGKLADVKTRGEGDAPFGALHVDANNYVGRFVPYAPLEEIASLPADDPCVALARFFLTLPEATPAGQAEMRKRKNMLGEFSKLPQLKPFSAPDFSRRPEGEVPKGKGRISSEPLYTSNLISCVAVAIRNPKTKKAVLVRGDTQTDPGALIAELAPELGDGPLEAVVAGGENSFAAMGVLYKALLALEKQKIRVTGFRKNPGGDSLAVDPRSGEFF